jgi:hypothetical protein
MRNPFRSNQNPMVLTVTAFILRSIIACAILYLIFALLFLSWWRDWTPTGMVFFIVLSIFSVLNNAK